MTIAHIIKFKFQLFDNFRQSFNQAGGIAQNLLHKIVPADGQNNQQRCYDKNLFQIDSVRTNLNLKKVLIQTKQLTTIELEL